MLNVHIAPEIAGCVFLTVNELISKFHVKDSRLSRMRTRLNARLYMWSCPSSRFHQPQCGFLAIHLLSSSLEATLSSSEATSEGKVSGDTRMLSDMVFACNEAHLAGSTEVLCKLLQVSGSENITEGSKYVKSIWTFRAADVVWTPSCCL